MGDSHRHSHGGNLPEPVPGSHFLHLEPAHPGFHYSESFSPAFCPCRFGRDDDEAHGQKNREDDLSGGFLSHQSEDHSRHLPHLGSELLEQSSRRDRRAAETQRRRKENRQSSGYPGLPKARHLCGYARASHFQPMGIYQNHHAREDGVRAPGKTSSTILD